jgi:hypothetical protein
MARESTITSSPSFRQGTRPDGECFRIAASLMLFSWRSSTSTSSKGRPARFSASQGRIDHVDHFFVPITNCIADSILRT